MNFTVFIKKRSKEAENKYKAYKNKLTTTLRFTEKHYYADMLEKKSPKYQGYLGNC